METRAAKRLRLELQDSEDTIQEESQVLKKQRTENQQSFCRWVLIQILCMRT